MSTRDRIIAAATAMMHEGAPRLSVRAVAARADVGASTLRHHFPTQRDLINAALTATYDSAMPDERIRDTSVPPRERCANASGGCWSPLALPQRRGSCGPTCFACSRKRKPTRTLEPATPFSWPRQSVASARGSRSLRKKGRCLAATTPGGRTSYSLLSTVCRSLARCRSVKCISRTRSQP